MTSEPKRSWGRWIAAIAIVVVFGAVGIFIAAQIPLAAPTIITGFLIVIVGVVLGLVVAIRRSDRASATDHAPMPATRRIRHAVLGSRSSDSDRFSSALRTSGRMPAGALGQEPGPFDAPPEEEVELDPEHLPWELRDTSETEAGVERPRKPQ